MKSTLLTCIRSTNALGLLREIVAVVVRWAGISLFIRKTISRRRATVIVYHDPTPQDLDRHLEYLASDFTFVPLSGLVDALRKNRWDRVPDHALVVTIDDGHKNNSQLFQVLNKYDVFPTVFACSHLVGTSRHFWWTEAGSLVPTVKRLPYRDGLSLLKRKTGFSPEKEYETRAALNEEELRILQSHAEIGSHSRFHPILVNCEREKCWKEVSISKLTLEEYISAPVSHFSYPNGDYSRREKIMALKAGYLSARTLDVGWVRRGTDPYRLKAMCVQDDASTNVLCAQVSGVFQYLHYFLRGSWFGRRPWGLS